jgi:hypothetical protein
MKLYTTVVLGAVVSVFCSAAAGLDNLPETAKLIPAQTALLVEASDFTRLQEQFKKTNWYQLYKAPAMANFVQHLEQKCREKLQQDGGEFASMLLSLDVRPTGRLAAAVMIGEWANKGEQFGVILISQWGQGIDKVKQAIDKAVQTALEQGAQRSVEEYSSVKIITITKQRPPLTVPQLDEEEEVSLKTIERAPLTVAYCLLGETVVGAVDVTAEAVRFTVAHIKGASGSTLAEDAEYTAAARTLGEKPDIWFYLNIEQLIKTSITQDSFGNAKKMLTNLGLDNVPGLAFAVDFARSTLVPVNGRGLLQVAGEKRGLLKIFEPTTARLNPPRFVSASSCSVSFLHIDIKRAYDELFKMLNLINPEMAEPLKLPLVPPRPDGAPGLELRKDVVEYLGSEIIVAESLDKKTDTTRPQTSKLVAVAVTNRAALEKSLATWYQAIIAPTQPQGRRELLGHTIYTLNLGVLPLLLQGGQGVVPMQSNGPEPQQLPKMAFTVTDSHIVIGSEPIVEQAVRSLSDSSATTIAGASWFIRAKTQIPGAVGAAAFSDDAAYAEQTWQQLRDSAAKTLTPDIPVVEPIGALVQNILQVADFGLLPEFEAVRKYFGYSVSYAVSRPDGFYFEFLQAPTAAAETN